MRGRSTKKSFCGCSPVEKPESPLDVEGVNLRLTTDEIVGMVREIRRR